MGRNIVKKLFLDKLNTKSLLSERCLSSKAFRASKPPVFEYAVSNPFYNRVFVWGNVSTGALGVPYKTKKSRHLRESVGYPNRLSFAENHQISVIGCGFGFTAMGVNYPKLNLYGTGLNTDSQIGYHEINRGKPLDITYFLEPINLPSNDDENIQIQKIRGGRSHLLVLTNKELFTLGNNSYGQCGRNLVENENCRGNKYIHRIEKIEGKTIKDIECGQDHSIILTQNGSVYSCGMGADGQTGLGHYNSTSNFTKLNGDISSENIIKLASKSDFNLVLNDRGEVFGWGNAEYNQILGRDDLQQMNTPTLIPLPGIGKIKDIATGGTFCAVLNEGGDVFVWGYGLLGVGPEVQMSKIPLHIPPSLFGRNDFQPNTTVEQLECGLNHICAITNEGNLYTWGRNKHRCLGLGDDKDRYFPLRVSLGGIVQTVQAGIDHTIALCKPFI